MNKDYRNKGFTLVEMIVVIVIIGILLAILVPGMFRYIQKAKEQQAIVECRAVVTAAQTLALELYSKNTLDYLTFLPDNKDIIISNANVNGKIQSLSFEESKPTLKDLTYITESNIKVLYDTTQGSIYQIVTEGKFSANAPGYYEYSMEKWSTDPSISEKKELNDKNLALQKLLYDNYGDIELSSSEKELFQNINKKLNWDAYHWSPIVTKDNSLILVASTDIYDPKQSKRAHASVIYYNDNYYYFYNNNSNPIGTTTIKTDFKVDQLINAPTTPPTTPVLPNYDTWVKVQN